MTHVTSRGNFKSPGVLHHALPVSSAVVARMFQTVAAPSISLGLRVKKLTLTLEAEHPDNPQQTRGPNKK